MAREEGARTMSPMPRLPPLFAMLPPSDQVRALRWPTRSARLHASEDGTSHLRQLRRATPGKLHRLPGDAQRNAQQEGGNCRPHCSSTTRPRDPSHRRPAHGGGVGAINPDGSRQRPHSKGRVEAGRRRRKEEAKKQEEEEEKEACGNTRARGVAQRRQARPSRPRSAIDATTTTATRRRATDAIAAIETSLYGHRHDARPARLAVAALRGDAQQRHHTHTGPLTQEGRRSRRRPQ